MEIDLTFYTDPGHGWLEVPNDLLKMVLPNLDISHYSYMKGHEVYLEEDADATKFLKAAKEQGYEVKIHESNTNSESRIRRYKPYNKSMLTFSNPF